MRHLLFYLVAFVGSQILSCNAGTPNPAELLPADTLLLFTVPDWDTAVAYWKVSAQGKLWQDQALKPVREKLAEKWKEDSPLSLQRQLGIKWTDFIDILHGQLTFALTRNTLATDPSGRIGIVLLMDAKDKESVLRTKLTDFKRKWVESGKQLKTENIRDVPVTTFIFSSEELNQAEGKTSSGNPPSLPDDDLDDANEAPHRIDKAEILLAQSGPLLILANNSKDIERILVRQSGGSISSLSEQAAYQTSHNMMFRDALVYAWMNFGPVFELVQNQMKAPSKSGPTETPFALHLDRMFAATGLGAVNTVAARLSGSGDGTSIDVFLNVPESRRRSLLNLLALDHKDAGPPPFVNSDVAKFKRIRVDGQKTWSTIENLLLAVSPEVSGLVQMALQAAGKERDPNFDLKRTLIGNLGDDFIAIEKSSASSKTSDLNSPSSLYLIGSPNPEQVAQGLKASTALMPLAGGDANVMEREFLGRKIYSLALAPGLDGRAEKPSLGQRQLHFAATAGYTAISTDAVALEEYLRTVEGSGKALRDRAGLAEAAQKVGGTSTGFFGYSNLAESIRRWLEDSKGENAALGKLLPLAPLAGGLNLSTEQRQKLGGLIDVSLLPPFEKISKYFSFLVYSISSSNEGISWKLFAPTPPQLTASDVSSK